MPRQCLATSKCQINGSDCDYSLQKGNIILLAVVHGRTPVGEACSAPSPPCRKVEDLQFRVEEESITKGDLEVMVKGPQISPQVCTPGLALKGKIIKIGRAHV